MIWGYEKSIAFFIPISNLFILSFSLVFISNNYYVFNIYAKHFEATPVTIFVVYSYHGDRCHSITVYLFTHSVHVSVLQSSEWEADSALMTSLNFCLLVGEAKTLNYIITVIYF